VKIT
jgi:hypothetical protein